MAALDVRYTLDPSSKERNTGELVKLLGGESTERRHALHGLDLLRSWDSDTSTYITAAQKRWPEASIFQKKA